ncbi:hypothetical protein [Butyrivibrio sp. MC2013]|uniref:hypothetical protein n=1 Tax=Butyrivibrio sp. MC2013 TaxID=1280686 RepID=UPI0003F5079E|nr:hypothetical protein [Butyrivibrio sp. MC2013]
MGLFDFFTARKKTSHRQKHYDYDAAYEKELDAAANEAANSSSDEEEKWERVSYSREGVNMDDPLQRREYVQNCLQQMEESSRELNDLQYEYRTVTAYLHDMEAVNELPQDKRLEINAVASRICDSQNQRQAYLQRSSKMTDREFERIDRLGDKKDEAVRKIKEAEDLQRKIRKDMMRLDNEREVYAEEAEDAGKTIKTCRTLMIFTCFAFAAIMIGLYITGIILKFNVMGAMMVTVFACALCITGLYLRHSSAVTQKRQVASARSRLIQLQNTIKVRYVNNINLMDYLYLKYGVQSGEELKTLISKYREEREQRQVFEETERQLGSDQRELLGLLRLAGVSTPEIWLHQAAALIDHNEEVEVRHALIVRRQNLRKRMDYNREVVIAGARNEVEDLARSYPLYANEILDQVARFRGVRL